jgi:hypothetical protein
LKVNYFLFRRPVQPAVNLLADQMAATSGDKVITRFFFGFLLW